MRALALLALLPLTAHAADLSYCKTYANRMSAMALQRLVGVPFVDAATGKFLYRKAYSSCLLLDEEPEMILSETLQPLIDGMPTPPIRPDALPGSVAATDPADDAPAEPVAPVKPKAKKAKAAQSSGATVAWGSPQPTCIKVHLRTVYSGRHWRCVK